MPLGRNALLLCAVLTGSWALSGAAAAAEDAALARARALLERVALVDGHNDLPWEIRDDPDAAGDVVRYDLRKRRTGDTDIPRLREGRVAAQFWSVWIPAETKQGFARTQLEQIDLALRMIDAYPESLSLATRAADIDRAKREGRIASFLGMENGLALEDSLGTLRAYYQLGVRYMTLTHSLNTAWADSATDEAKHGGLTPFGREVVREMAGRGCRRAPATAPCTLAGDDRATRWSEPLEGRIHFPPVTLPPACCQAANPPLIAAAL